MFQPGDALPHFQVRTTAGEVFRYVTIWQHNNLVLLIAGSDTDDSYVAAVTARAAEFRELDATLVVTRDEAAGMHAPGVLIADKWGEVVHVAAGTGIATLAPPEELLEWLAYVARRCPECEGEAK